MMDSMDKDDVWEKILTAFIIALVCFGMVVALSGCKTVKTVVEYRELQVHDTITRVDSVWHDRWHTEVMRGDTVFIHDSVTDWKYKTLEKIVEVCKTDSVPYPVEVEVPVKYVPAYYHFASWAFWILAAILAMVIAIWIIKKTYLRK